MLTDCDPTRAQLSEGYVCRQPVKPSRHDHRQPCIAHWLQQHQLSVGDAHPSNAQQLLSAISGLRDAVSYYNAIPESVAANSTLHSNFMQLARRQPAALVKVEDELNQLKAMRATGYPATGMLTYMTAVSVDSAVGFTTSGSPPKNVLCMCTKRAVSSPNCPPTTDVWTATSTCSRNTTRQPRICSQGFKPWGRTQVTLLPSIR